MKNHHGKKSLVFLTIYAAISLVQSCKQTEYVATIDENYNALFTRTEGWTGGDIAHTVPLSDSVFLWLFGDSWVGHIAENRHFDSEMVNNAVAIQKGKDAKGATLKFYYDMKDNKPAPLFVPPDSIGFFWLTGGGIMTDNGLYLVAGQIAKIENDTTVWGFESVGKSIIHITNPADEPTEWKSLITKIPFYYRDNESTEIEFGIPSFIADGFIYVYGTELSRKEMERYMLLARVPEKEIPDPHAWEFFSDGKWQKDFKKAGRLCNHYGAEYSVEYHPGIKRYVTIYSEMGLSDKIMLRTSRRPEGPWSDQKLIYTTPETVWDRDYFCYAARGHAGLSGAEDLLVSYVCNSTDFRKMAADARIYRPKFIRIKLK